MPRVSLIMTVRNGERYLSESISSLIHQSFIDTEIVVVDNGSKDGTSEILASIDDPRLKIISVDPNLNSTFASGISRAFNAATGEYIAVQDSDDISDKSRIKKQVHFLEEHQDVGLVGSKFKFIDQYGGYLFTTKDFPNEFPDIFFSKSCFGGAIIGFFSFLGIKFNIYLLFLIY